MQFSYFRSEIQTLDSLVTSENRITGGHLGGFRYFSDAGKGSLYLAIEGVPGSAKSMLALQIMACRVEAARKARLAELERDAPNEPTREVGPNDVHRGGVFFALEHDAQALVEIIARFRWIGDDAYKSILIYKSPREKSNPTQRSSNVTGWFEITVSVDENGVLRQDKAGKPVLELQQVEIEAINDLRWWLFIVEIPPGSRSSLIHPREPNQQQISSDTSQKEILRPNEDAIEYSLSELLCYSRTPERLHKSASSVKCEELITQKTDLVVLDSLPAFLAAFGHGKALRNTLADARQKMSDTGRHLIIVTELSVEEPTSAPFLDREEVFLPDVVLRLGFWRGNETWTGQRYLEVRKARYQAFPAGRHELSILGPQTTATHDPTARGPLMCIPPPIPGININASLAWKLDVWSAGKKRKWTAWEQQNEACNLGIPSLDRQIDSRNSRGIPRGTSVGIIAEHGAGSTAIGLHFLAEGLRTSQHSENCLLISFDHDEESLKRKVNQYEFLRNNLLSAPGNDKWADRFHVHTRMLARLPAERLIQRIEEFLDEMLRRGTPITRVMVDSLGAYRARYPLLAASDLFPNALVRLFSSRRVTSAIVDLVTSAVERDFQNASDSVIETLADTVIAVGHVTLQGRNCRAVFVRQSASGTPSSEVHELQEHYGSIIHKPPTENLPVQSNRPTRESATRWLAVSSERFETYTGIFSKHPSPVPLRLVLYTDSIDPMVVAPDHTLSPVARYKRSLVETLTIGVPHVTGHFFGPNIHSNACGAVHAFGEAPRTDTCLVEFDGHWLRELEASRLILPWKAALPAITQCPHEWTESFLRFPHTEHSSFVPHYVDLGLFVEQNVGRQAGPQASSERETSAPPSWKELANRARQHNVSQMTSDDWNSNPFFDFDRTVPEAMCCMLIELLLAFLKPIRDARSKLNPSDSNLRLEFVNWGPLAADHEWLSVQRTALPLKIWFPQEHSEVNQLVLDAILTFKSLFPNSTEVKRTITHAKTINRAAIWQRQWFSTLYSGVKREELHRATTAGKSPTIYRVYRGMPDSQIEHQYSSPVAGTWHLGIVSGSASPRLAWRVVNEITSIAADYRKLAEGVGLPCRRVFYESTTPNFFPAPVELSPSPSEIKQVYLDSFSRSWIAHYRQIAPILLGCFHELILSEPDMAPVKEILRRNQAQLDLAYSMLPA